MLGNAWEWTEDCWNANYNGAPSQGSAWTEGDCGQRVLRGGSWFNNARGLRSATRYSAAGSRSSSWGFRVARAL
jgi:formylglycine-generating enzyme required for sulfatase activity